MDEAQLPPSTEEVVLIYYLIPSTVIDFCKLVQRLYRPGRPEQVSEIQETLHKLQRSPNGWLMAQVLLSSNDENAMFFGALTFTVKLNTDSQSLSREEARALLQKLIGWLIYCLESKIGAVVIRKLCSTLVTYFLYFPTEWTDCVQHLMFCLCINQSVLYTDLQNAPHINMLVQTLSGQKSFAVFCFAAGLVDEVGKIDLNSQKQHVYQQYIQSNINAIVPLMKYYIDVAPDEGFDAKIRQEAVSCLQSWITFSERVSNDETIIRPLQSLSEPAMMCLADENLYEYTVEMFTDMFANYSKFARAKDYALLYSLLQSPWGKAKYDRLVQGDYEFDSLQFGQLMLAFGDARVQHLAETAATDPQSSQYLAQMMGLLGGCGSAVHEDKIFVLALEFWSTFMFVLTDEANTENTQQSSWVTAAEPLAMQVVDRCWLKIQFPLSENFDLWDKTDQTDFKHVRADVSDILQQVYLLIGARLFALLTDLLLKLVQDRDVGSKLEAAMYCLSQLPDCVANNEEDEYLDLIFASPLLSLVTEPSFAAPLRTKQSLFTLINHYSTTQYFQRHTGQRYLSACLYFMISLTHSPSLGIIAATSIHSFCGSCRAVLVPHLPAFLQQYSQMTKSPTLDGHVKENFIGAISFIIQALPSDESRMLPLQQLLDFVETEHTRSLELRASASRASITSNQVVSTDSYSAGLELGLVALRCLVKIGLGLRTPDDHPIDLEKSNTNLDFWTSGDGAVVQERITKVVISSLEAYEGDGEVIEEACSIFGAGFTEMEPGPFVFRALLIAQVLVGFGLDTMRIGTLMKTACIFISSYNKLTERIDDVAAMLLAWVAELLNRLEEPGRDPEVTQHGLDFLCRLTPKYLNVLLNHQPSANLEKLFMFSLKALEGGDPLPKFAAADFWASFLALKNQDRALQGPVDIATQYFGPIFTRALVHNVSGNAARSELDKLCEPLKKLVVSQVHSKAWLQAALLENDSLKDRVTEKDKMLFLQKVIKLAFEVEERRIK